MQPQQKKGYGKGCVPHLSQICMKIDVLPRDCTTDLSHATCVPASSLLVHFPLTSVKAGHQSLSLGYVLSQAKPALPGPWSKSELP